MVVAKQEAQAAWSQLQEEKLRTDALLQRQHELIACLSLVAEAERAAGGNSASVDMLQEVGRCVAEAKSDATGRVGGAGGGATAHIELLELLGEGT